ncbi:hypothetical protein MMC06_003115 [Schaereria dolodes]|nr:hypothetical protein [Schaereria dolodes]
MVFYIRFLKPPTIVNNGKANKARIAVKALITITTDLGDDFYQNDIDLRVILSIAPLTEKARGETVKMTITWKKGFRTLRVEIPIEHTAVSRLAQLQLSSNVDTEADLLQPNKMPEVVNAWSGIHSVSTLSNTIRKVERRFLLENGHMLRISEETGESIARHIWDAGVALIAYIGNVLRSSSEGESWTSHVRRQPSSRSLNVLELGSGVGIVGIGCAQLMPFSNVLLTDLPEAMDILEYNISRAQPAESSALSSAVLDWGVDLPATFAKQPYDLLLVSDCTYNPDRIPALVHTLFALTSLSETTDILISMKVRHPSEALFFDLMSDTGFVIVEKVTLVLPDNYRSCNGETLETVQIYIFRLMGFASRR